MQNFVSCQNLFGGKFVYFEDKFRSRTKILRFYERFFSFERGRLEIGQTIRPGVMGRNGTQ